MRKLTYEIAYEAFIKEEYRRIKIKERMRRKILVNKVKKALKERFKEDKQYYITKGLSALLLVMSPFLYRSSMCDSLDMQQALLVADIMAAIFFCVDVRKLEEEEKGRGSRKDDEYSKKSVSGRGVRKNGRSSEEAS